jgi:hypothetical protein
MEKIMDKVTGTRRIGTFDKVRTQGSAGGLGDQTYVTADIIGSGFDHVADVRTLIQAAPDLLAACEDLIGLAVTGAKELAKGINGGVSEETDDADGLPAGWEIRTRIEQARAAIAKAKGTP